MFAAVDLGSNSFRLHVGAPAEGEMRIVRSARDPVRLAAGLQPDGSLGEAAIGAAVRSLEGFAAILHEYRLDAMRVVSPAIALQDALERLAGSDAARALRFQTQAHGFLLEVRRLVHRHLDEDRLLTVADYDRGLPSFTLREAPATERLGALLFDAAVIALGMAALLLAAGRQLRRHVTFTE